MNNFSEKANFIWSVAELLRGPYRPNQYKDVMLPMTVLRRLDCVLEPTKDAVLAKLKSLEGSKVQNVEPILNKVAGQSFHNTSRFTFEKLKGEPDNIAANLTNYIKGFSPRARDIIEHFGFEEHIDKLDKAGRLYQIVSKFCEVDLHPDKVPNIEMGYIFEELIRKFNEASNEEAGDHYYNTRSFASYLTDMQPDVVVSTHFLSSNIVSFLKSRGHVRSRLITVITDFGVHPFWLSPSTDCYCVASEATRHILQTMGVSLGIIQVTGIPVDPKFTRAHDRKEICGRLGIDVQRTKVLVVTGSFGIGPLEEIVQRLYTDYEVLAVCARNKKLYARLKAQCYPHTHVFGFVDNIDDLMAVADVIITKPGGLTISESLCMDLMPLFIAAIPGQESMNVEVLHQAGIGSSIADLRDIESQVALCVRDASRIKVAIHAFKKTNAVLGIYDVIRSGSSGTAR